MRAERTLTATRRWQKSTKRSHSMTNTTRTESSWTCNRQSSLRTRSYDPRPLTRNHHQTLWRKRSSKATKASTRLIMAARTPSSERLNHFLTTIRTSRAMLHSCLILTLKFRTLLQRTGTNNLRWFLIRCSGINMIVSGTIITTSRETLISRGITSRIYFSIQRRLNLLRIHRKRLIGSIP